MSSGLRKDPGEQHKQLAIFLGNIVMKAKTETELIADCHGGTEVNLVTALGFYRIFSFLESLLNLEQKHAMVTTISVEVFPGVFQTEEKYIGKWREVIEAEMNIRQSKSQPITKVIVGIMMAIRWLEAHVKENNRQEAPT